MKKTIFAIAVAVALLLSLPMVVEAQYSYQSTGNVGATSSTPPTGAQYDGKLWIFFRDTGGDISYITTTNTAGGGPFTAPVKLTTPTTNPEPRAITFGGKLYLFYGEDGGAQRLFYRSYTTATGWSGEVQVPFAVTRHRPGLAVLNNNLLHIFWETAGSDNRIRYVSLDALGGFYHPPGYAAEVPSARTVWAPTATTYNGSIYVTHGGESGGSSQELWYSALLSNNTWTAHGKVPGSVRSSYPPTSAVFGGQLHVYYSGATTYRLLRKRLNGASWSGEEWLSPLGAVGGSESVNFGSRLWLLQRGNSGEIDYLVL